jgi:hypothetical protein
MLDFGLAKMTEQPALATVGVDVVQLQPGDFHAAHAGRVERLQDGAVAQAFCARYVRLMLAAGSGVDRIACEAVLQRDSQHLSLPNHLR